MYFHIQRCIKTNEAQKSSDFHLWHVVLKRLYKQQSEFPPDHLDRKMGITHQIRKKFILWRLPMPLVRGQTQHGNITLYSSTIVHCVQSLYTV
jgi:hypothetical protein